MSIVDNCVVDINSLPFDVVLVTVDKCAFKSRLRPVNFDHLLIIV